MKIKDVIIEGRNILSEIEDNKIIVKELLSYVLNKDEQYLICHDDDEIEEKYYLNFKEFVNEIKEGKPLQYIINKQEFMGLDFFVDENVLIPQPDTEILVEEVIRIAKLVVKAKQQKTQEKDEYTKEEIYEKQALGKNTNKEESGNNPIIKILDLCTGSGAIAIAIKKELEKANINSNIVASDISSKALQVAEKNSKINNANIKFIESDLFENVKEKFDLIVSNPPYVKSNIIEMLDKQVQAEPKIALDGGEDGLDFYKKILEKAYAYVESGYLCFEIGYDQKNDLIQLIQSNANYEYINTVKDLSNNDRCIIVKVK